VESKKKITAIEVQAKRKNRRSIFLDGEFAFGINVEVLLRHGLGIGDELSQQTIDAILEDEQRKGAKDKAFRLLSVRARSEKEIRDRLKESGFMAPTIEWAIAELIRIGLLNDRDFAQMYARSRMVTHPVGSFLLRRELSAKGVSDGDIEIGLAEAYKETDEAEVAWKLAAQRKKRYVNIDEQKAKKRVSDFLIRRGFGWDIVYETLERWEELY
jgi:regulatory protein